MGYFLLAQMDDFFAEGMCFDTSKEGERGSANPTLPRSAKGKAKGRAKEGARKARPRTV
jgi:hypothetical protein